MGAVPIPKTAKGDKDVANTKSRRNNNAYRSEYEFGRDDGLV